ncbi:hypothetical protein HYY75_00350 [bacterium]|nr:hypothetical protein [bacterium]
MNKFGITFFCILIAVFFILPAFSADHHHSGFDIKPQTKCPVTGETISKKFFSDYQGHRIYFSRPESVDKFKREPSKFISKLSLEGITLEKSPESIKNQNQDEPSDHSGHKRESSEENGSHSSHKPGHKARDTGHSSHAPGNVSHDADHSPQGSGGASHEAGHANENHQDSDASGNQSGGNSHGENGGNVGKEGHGGHGGNDGNEGHGGCGGGC